MHASHTAKSFAMVGLVALAGLLAGCGESASSRANAALSQGSSAEQHRDYKTALADFNAAEATGAADARAYYDAGMAQYNLKQWTAAAASYTEALRRVAAGDTALLPTYVHSAYYYRGISYIWTGKWAAAKSDLLVAVRYYPKDWLDWDSLGYARAQLGDFRNAVADYDRGIPYYPRDAVDHFNRGYALYRIGSTRLAIADFTAAIHLSPRFGVAYQDRGLAYVARGDYKLADKDYTEAIKLIPKAWAWEYRCEARENLGRVKEAVYDCNHAIAMYPRWSSAYVARAWGRAVLGNNKGALADANLAVKYDPTDAQAYKYRGWIRVRLAEYRAAFIDYNTALRIAPHYTDASVARSTLANWIVAAQSGGVRAYGIGSINVAQAESERQPTQSEYEKRVGECGGYFSEGDSYYDDCLDKGVDEAKDDESADQEAADQAAAVDYDVAQQVQEQINYNTEEAENAAAAASEAESENESESSNSEDSQESSESEESQPDDSSSESEPESEPEPAAPESEGDGE